MLLAASLVTATLAVGDVAPPLPVEHWLQRPQAALPPPGHVTVVEFWATWCGPCIANIPHLTALQKKYGSRGLVVAGATSEDAWGNDRASVEKLIAAKGKSFDYPVALLADPKKSGIHRNAWYVATGVEWLPCAFVIGRDGRIAYIGDPMQVEEVVASILDGKWDFRAAKSRYAAAIEARELLGRMKAAIEKKDRPAALTLARRVYAAGLQDPHSMLSVSDSLVHSPWPRDREVLDVALDAAERAVALTKRESPGMLDALARVWSLRGDPAKAVEIESLAVQKSEGPMRDAQLKNLETYRAAVRTPR